MMINANILKLIIDTYERINTFQTEMIIKHNYTLNKIWIKTLEMFNASIVHIIKNYKIIIYYKLYYSKHYFTVCIYCIEIPIL